jgi:hypothetical protein
MSTTSTPPQATTIDLYREVHKGLRNGIFQVTVAAGAANPDDDDAVAELTAHVRDLVQLLRAHAGHEDRHIDPLLERHAPEIGAELAVAHDTSEAALDELSSTAGALEHAGADRPALLATLYDRLADFTVSYLAHLRDEEGIAMPALAAALPPSELLDVQNAIRGQITPDEMCRFIQLMVPAMDPDERAAMLTGMQAAPPELFTQFRDAARSALPEDQWRELSRRLSPTDPA